MPISLLLDYSLAVVGIELIIVWLTVKFFLEPYLMPRLFPTSFPTMSFAEQRSLTNHVVSCALKLLCFIGAYSIIEIFISRKALDSPLKLEDELNTLTNGDVLAFCYLTVPTIYLFELLYRTRISAVSAIHHIAAITINILGLVVVIAEHQRGFLAETEFKLIVIYGIFEMGFEVFPHISILLYRRLRDRPHFLRLLFLYTALLIFTGTFLEQFAIGIFYFHVWRRLPMFYKAIGPILHMCFMAAQIHGGRVCLQISKKMGKEAREKVMVEEDPEGAHAAVSPVMMEESGGGGTGNGALVNLNSGAADLNIEKTTSSSAAYFTTSITAAAVDQNEYSKSIPSPNLYTSTSTTTIPDSDSSGYHSFGTVPVTIPSESPSKAP